MFSAQVLMKALLPMLKTRVRERRRDGRTHPGSTAGDDRCSVFECAHYRCPCHNDRLFRAQSGSYRNFFAFASLYFAAAS
jgi:hypothetical protein